MNLDEPLFPRRFVINKIKSSIDIQYWDYQFNQDNSIKNNKSYLDELKSLFEQAIYNNLISDVEIGSYLSGGIDSGTITAITKNKLHHGIWITFFNDVYLLFFDASSVPFSLITVDIRWSAKSFIVRSH